LFCPDSSFAKCAKLILLKINFHQCKDFQNRNALLASFTDSNACQPKEQAINIRPRNPKTKLLCISSFFKNFIARLLPTFVGVPIEAKD